MEDDSNASADEGLPQISQSLTNHLSTKHTWALLQTRGLVSWGYCTRVRKEDDLLKPIQDIVLIVRERNCCDQMTEGEHQYCFEFSSSVK